MFVRRARLLTLLGLTLATPAFAQVAPADQDGDGVPDDRDVCPTTKEDPNGVNDEDGCPDAKVAALSEIAPAPGPVTPGSVAPVQTAPAPVAPAAPVPAAPVAATSDSAPAPAVAAALPAAFTCAGRVVSDGTLAEATMQCDGQTRTWLIIEDAGYDLPDAIFEGATGTFGMKPVSEQGASLVMFTDINDVVHMQTVEDDCFLTTAASRNRGLPDDCAALQAMRAFRDEVLGRDHPDVLAYEAFAPAVVAAVQARPDARQVWDVLFEDYLTPILAQIAAGQNEAAHAAYRCMVEDLRAGLRV